MRGEPIRAAVISDTHGLLRPEVEQVIQSCDVVIHGGDFDTQMLYHKLNIGQPLYGVRGNNDGYWAAQLPKMRRFELGGVSFFLVHDQEDAPSDLEDVQVVIFGHSHRYFCREREGRLWLNPGSCGHRRFHLPLSLAVLTIQEGHVSVEPVWLEGEELEEREDQLFRIAKIMRFMKRGDPVDWVARNMKADPEFVEQIYRIILTHPGIDARKVMDKMEVNGLYPGVGKETTASD